MSLGLLAVISHGLLTTTQLEYADHGFFVEIKAPPLTRCILLPHVHGRQCHTVH